MASTGDPPRPAASSTCHPLLGLVGLQVSCGQLFSVRESGLGADQKKCGLITGPVPFKVKTGVEKSGKPWEVNGSRPRKAGGAAQALPPRAVPSKHGAETASPSSPDSQTQLTVLPATRGLD